MKISDDVKTVLQDSKVIDNKLYLPDRQLDRALYMNVNKVLIALEGKWSRKEKAHIFSKSVKEILSEVIETEKYTDKKKEFQFFETPEPLAKRMIKIANIQKGERVLEPSAGRGAIAKHIKGRVDCIELNPDNYDYLKQKGFNLVGRNTLECGTRYNVIIANPPFSNQQDIDHIKHLITLTDRCLVCICSAGVLFRENKKTREFREELDLLGATIEELPKGTFKQSGTMVNACLIVINKETR